MKPLPIEHPKDRRGAAGKSPTERTMDFLKELGYPSWIVERRIRRDLSVDLFHIIDVVALTPHGVLGVQSTGSDFSGHYRNVTIKRALDSARWLQVPGNNLMLISWRKIKKKRGGQQFIWAPRVKMITTDMLMPALERARRLDLLEPVPEPETPLWEKYLEEK